MSLWALLRQRMLFDALGTVSLDITAIGSLIQKKIMTVQWQEPCIIFYRLLFYCKVVTRIIKPPGSLLRNLQKKSTVMERRLCTFTRRSTVTLALFYKKNTTFFIQLRKRKYLCIGVVSASSGMSGKIICYYIVE